MTEEPQLQESLSSIGPLGRECISTSASLSLSHEASLSDIILPQVTGAPATEHTGYPFPGQSTAQPLLD
eukprot:3013835-Prorocentrum_lima.AAC.1